MQTLRGKTALITGASGVIGKAIALAAARAGMKLALCCHSNRTGAERLLEAVRELGAEGCVIQADLSAQKGCARMAEEAAERFSALDVLVNNAGVNKPEDFDRITEEDWDRILSVNLKGPFFCIQALLPLLRASGRASVINIGSVSGQYGGPRTAHYAASKAGLISLGQVAARFGARDGIRVNTLAVGVLDNEMGAAGLQNPAVQKACESILLGRLGSARDVAEAVLFLASDASSYITAQTINVNGGLYF